jgi:hypothetical protein
VSDLGGVVQLVGYTFGGLCLVAGPFFWWLSRRIRAQEDADPETPGMNVLAEWGQLQAAEDYPRPPKLVDVPREGGSTYASATRRADALVVGDEVRPL